MRTLPVLFSQLNPQWANLPLGTSATTKIGSDGCYLTAMAMVACYYGKSSDPEQLNKFLITNNLYVDGDLIGGDDTLNKVYPDINFEQDYFYPNQPPTPADLTLLHSLLDDPTVSVILEINLGNHQHFVVATGCNGTVTIADPESGTVVDFKTLYGDPATNIIKFIVFSGTPATTAVSPLMYKGLNLNDTASMKVCVDVSDEVTNQGMYVTSAEYVTLQNINVKITGENKNLNDDLAKVYKDLSDYHAADKTAVDQGQEATEEADDVKAAFDKLTAYFKITGPFSSFLDISDQIISKTEEIEEPEPVTVPPVVPQTTSNSQPASQQTNNGTGFFSKVLSGFVNLFWQTESKS